MSRFILTFLAVYWTAHVYVIWRIVRLPWVREHRLGWVLGLAMVVMGAGYPLARILSDSPTVSRWSEILGADWMGVFFYLFLALFVVDVVTLGGFLVRGHGGMVRTGAVLLGLAVSAIALVQGHRDPVVTTYTVTVPGLPKEKDGFKLAAISDLHLGTQFRGPWLERVVDQVNGLGADAIAVVGDLIDRDAKVVEPLTPILAKLKAPLGVYSVAGNHEYYADERLSVEIMERAGYVVLRNRSVEVVPGLHLAGVDDLTIASRGGQGIEPLLAQTLAAPRVGGTVLLSHTPLGHASAAQKGVGLMISGHTHDGQIWPFRYFVKNRYPLTYGTESFGEMTALVTRGAGGWGPRMRLPGAGEIVLITLRAKTL